MKTMTTRTMMPLRRAKAAMKVNQTRMLSKAPNHNVHVITHHGKLMLGRKGRKV
jgi:hypothetical protein